MSGVTVRAGCASLGSYWSGGNERTDGIAAGTTGDSERRCVVAAVWQVAVYHAAVYY